MAQENITWDTPKPQENISWDEQPQVSAYDKFLNSLKNPQTGGKSGIVGPMILGGTGELIKGAGALTQMAFPEAGSRMVEVGSAITEGAKSVAPVSTTVGQVGSYVAPFSAAQKGVTAIGNIPKVAQNLSKIPSFARATGEQAFIGSALGYGLTPDEQNREKAALYGGAFGAATPTLEKGVQAIGSAIRGPSASQGTLQAAKQGQEAGFVIPPTQVNASLLNRAIEGTAGKLSTAQNASFKNQQVTNKLAAKSLGLPEETVITPEILTNLRTTAGQSYDAISNVGTITPTANYFQALDEIKQPFIKILKDFPNQKPSPVIELVDSLKSPSFDASSLVANIRQLRTQADDAFRTGNTDVARASKKAASVMEDALEEHLKLVKNTDALKNFRDARQLIAKTYSVEKAINPATGTIQASKLAQQLRAGKPLSGELKQIGEFSSAFPTATKTTEAMGSLPQISPLDVGGALLAGGGTYLSGSGGEGPITLAALLARPALRSLALSKPVQSRLTNQQMQNMSPETRNLARMLMLQGATKAGANEEKQ
jgi:hypothetical protein